LRHGARDEANSIRKALGRSSRLSRIRRSEICLVPGAAFQHDEYTLKADNVLIFALMDDYVEQIELTHAVPDGPALELPLSAQGGKTVNIRGGCVPQSKDVAEVARVCNFSWGKRQIVKDVRFEFN
jgi:hypothetical protein